MWAPSFSRADTLRFQILWCWFGGRPSFWPQPVSYLITAVEVLSRSGAKTADDMVLQRVNSPE